MSNKYLEKIASWVDEDGGLDKEASTRLTREILEAVKSGRMSRDSEIVKSLKNVSPSDAKGKVRDIYEGTHGVDLTSGKVFKNWDDRPAGNRFKERIGEGSTWRRHPDPLNSKNNLPKQRYEAAKTLRKDKAKGDKDAYFKAKVHARVFAGSRSLSGTTKVNLPE